ncbi:TetR/AcrR family transcriptional regulator C-terminal domain-containing protein [Glutamicibacter sp. JL.03c]|uniref:TetR/AcrR family transcriptional regulator C-terminal domain-containing protein n=1 Tax=Glutamicibacter sp. JL.03c TaxID=2984842 RepID=UPI0021F76749|nr:TetR/AcrR family transcriptional regulator C-terminal domain-containing protein [Glutamicibacter sp. JL.03c]UYQ77491.1 TetR/AcrR family transcriptional regulator C-terminal domain-containing protein [Glutamicibacter sp. JL.03c]
MSQRVAGRPATPILTQQVIVEAAFALLDEVGSEEFSMGRLARSLDVRTPALYNHVDNRQHLVNLMRRDIVRSIDRSMLADLPWTEALFHFSVLFREALLKVPAAAELIVATPISEESESGVIYEEMGRILRRAGVAVPRILMMMVAIESLVVGAVLDIVAPGAHVTTVPVAGEGAVQSSHGEVMELGEKYAHQARTTVSDQSFEFGLRAIIAAIEREVAQS